MLTCFLLSDQSSSPDIAQAISLAFERVCEGLGLRLQDDPATRLVAEKIIALAQGGIKDANVLRDMTLREFDQEPS